MIMNFLRRVPAGMMVVPLFLGCLVNTFVPDALQIGGITTATFSSAGGNCALGILLFLYGYETEAQRDARGFKAGRAAPGGEVCDRCDFRYFGWPYLWPCRYSWHLKYGNHLCGHKQ
ncbi:MAG: 2-keto-3-deoxygluconate permease [Sellimonas intestinalis]